MKSQQAWFPITFVDNGGAKGLQILYVGSLEAEIGKRLAVRRYLALRLGSKYPVFARTVS